MPGPDWRDVQRRQASARAPAPVPGRVEPPRLPQPADGSPLGRLMAQRQALEQRMQMLTGEAPPDPRTAALYQVRPMAERRAEHDAWQLQREREAQRARADLADRRRSDDPQRAPRVDGRDEADAVAGDPALRPTRGERGPPLRGTAADRQGRRRPGPGEAPLRALSGLREKLGGLDRALGDADRQLAERGMSREREDLAQMKKDMGLDRILSGAGKLDDMLERGAPSSRSPERAERVVEDDWLKRRDAIGGQDMESYQRGFKERAARLFGVDTGTIDQVGERLQRLRESSLDRKRETQEEERRDEERRARAVQRRREGADER
ncbi:MAG TPA: hypothetical protein VFZ91_02255 [Allosphingosinicella sp.]